MDANKKDPSANAELERRRMIYKNLRKELDKDEQVAKEQKYEKRMEELEHKASLKQAQKRQQIIEVAQEEEKKEAAHKNS